MSLRILSRRGFPNILETQLKSESESCPVMSDSLWLYGLYSPWNSPGQNTGVGSLSLHEGIFPTQGLNPGLLHCRQILYQLSHQGSPRVLEWIAYPFSSGSSPPRNWTGSPSLQVDSLPTELSRKPHRLEEWTHDCWQGRCGEGKVREFGMGMYPLLYLKWIISKVLLYSTWNSAQYLVAWMGGRLGEWIHVYVWLSPFAVHLKLSQHCLLIGYTPIQKKKPSSGCWVISSCGSIISLYHILKPCMHSC